MKSSPSVSKARKKAVWGRMALIALFLAFFAVFSVSAVAGPAKDKASNNKSSKQHAKLDRELNKLADGIGDSDVIVEFNDDTDSSARITASVSCTMVGMRMRLPMGMLWPMPRLSNQQQVKRFDSTLICGRHPSPITPTPWISSTGGPSPAVQ